MCDQLMIGGEFLLCGYNSNFIQSSLLTLGMPEVLAFNLKMWPCWKFGNVEETKILTNANFGFNHSLVYNNSNDLCNSL